MNRENDRKAQEREGRMQNESSNVLNDFQHGDLAAFETLFRLHQRAVYGWLLRIVRNHAAAEDLTVETFWRIHNAHACFDPSQGFEGWARRIATHAALDWLRTRRAECELPADLSAPATTDPAIAAEIRSKGIAGQRSSRSAGRLRRRRKSTCLSCTSIAEKRP